jgi:hypothetical protein
MVRYAVVLIFVTCCFAAFAEDTVPPPLSPEEEAAAIWNAEVTGVTIYRHDHAAAVATDAALALPTIRADKRVKGWITEEKKGDIAVTFIDQTPAALYRVVVSNNGVAGPVTTLATPTPLTAYESAAVLALQTASEATFERCAENYNYVALPTTETAGKNWVVYFLPGTSKKNLVPIGGTYRVETSGSNIISQRGFTRSCIALETDPKDAALWITHILDVTPTEAHVFWSLWANTPIYVGTPDDTVWVVEGNKIRLVERNGVEG